MFDNGLQYPSRRTLLRAMGGLLASVAMVNRGAAASRPKLGALFVQSATGPTADIQYLPFLAELKRLGWIDGQTIDIDARFAGGDVEKLAPLAAEIVAAKPDLIYTHTSAAARIVGQATRTIPIVVSPGVEEDVVALAGDMARPRTNVTGQAFISRDIHEKSIELLTQAAPGLRRIAVLVNPDLPTYRGYPESMATGLAPLGVTLLRVETPGGAPGLDVAFETLAGLKADALLVLTMPGFNDATIARRVIERAAKLKIAVVGGGDFYAREGGLIAFGPDYVTLVKKGVAYVDRILRGAKVADLPVESPSVFKLVVNKAAALGLTLPPAILLRADEVIE